MISLLVFIESCLISSQFPCNKKSKNTTIDVIKCGDFYFKEKNIYSAFDSDTVYLIPHSFKLFKDTLLRLKFSDYTFSIDYLTIADSTIAVEDGVEGMIYNYNRVFYKGVYSLNELDTTLQMDITDFYVQVNNGSIIPSNMDITGNYNFKVRKATSNTSRKRQDIYLVRQE